MVNNKLNPMRRRPTQPKEDKNFLRGKLEVGLCPNCNHSRVVRRKRGLYCLRCKREILK